MKAPIPNSLACGLRGFFGDHLPKMRGMSPHTLHSYRDGLKLLLRFVSARRGKDVAALVSMEDLMTLEAVEDRLDVRMAERILMKPGPTKTLGEIKAKFGLAKTGKNPKPRHP